MVKLIKLITMLVLMGIISGCNSYTYLNVKSADTSQKVRHVTIKDSDGKLVGERHELYNAKLASWFEAAASKTGSFELTPAGKAAQALAAEDAARSMKGGGGC